MTMKQSAPDAQAIRATPDPDQPGLYIIEILCPYCGGIHAHGWRGPGTPGGHRRPHCWVPAAQKVNAKGYNILITEDLRIRDPSEDRLKITYASEIPARAPSTSITDDTEIQP